METTAADKQKTRDTARGCGITFIIIVWVIILVNVKSCLWPNTTKTDNQWDYDSKTNKAPVLEQSIYTTAPNIYSDYETNAINADSKYLNKKIQITGYIYEIGTDINHMPYIELWASKNEFFNVRCYLKSTELDAASKLLKGRNITLIGIGNGFPMKSVQLRECTIQ